MDESVGDRTHGPAGSRTFTSALATVEAIRNSLEPNERALFARWFCMRDADRDITMIDPVQFSVSVSGGYPPTVLSNCIAMAVTPWNIMEEPERNYLQNWLTILDDNRVTLHGRQDDLETNPEEANADEERVAAAFNFEMSQFATADHFEWKAIAALIVKKKWELSKPYGINRPKHVWILRRRVIDLYLEGRKLSI